MGDQKNKDDDVASHQTILRVGGVPEHFNEPWQLALEQHLFEQEGVQIEWHSIKEGTGAMINKLKAGEVDVIVALTEGLVADIANGSDLRLLGTYVESPLLWAISTGAKSSYNSIEDLKGQKFGISRFNSGSHLMSCVLATQYGWAQSDIEYVVNNDFETLRKSVNDNSTAAFMWESFMQKPYHDKGEIRRIGEILTPWPCFMIASTKTIVGHHLTALHNMFTALRCACTKFQTDSTTSINRISNKFHLREEDAKAWYDKVNITANNNIAESTIETVLDALKTANILKSTSSMTEPIKFIDTRLARLTVDIKSMRLYNKPELLIALRNNLRAAGLSKGQLSYTDLLPFDQNHYYGTEILDLAVQELKLSSSELGKEDNSNTIIQIGSNLAGCSRYLAGKYHLKVLAIELQNDLSQAANELTDRCGLSGLVHHIAGNFLTVADHLQQKLYTAIVSWITILHFTESERMRLIAQCHRLLVDNGYFYCEDFIRVGNVTNEESQILEHDVYCRYLPTLDEYKDQLTQGGFEIIKAVDLTDDWREYTAKRLNEFHQKKPQLLKIHGEEIYNRLEFFYASIVKLFKGKNVGGARIVAKKTDRIVTE